MSSINERAAQHEPEPIVVSDDGPSIQDLVIQDMEARKQVGLQRYGTLLQTHNGRDSLMDFYQEILDAANYARQELERRQQARQSAEEIVASVKGYLPKHAYKELIARLSEFVRAQHPPGAPR